MRRKTSGWIGREFRERRWCSNTRRSWSNVPSYGEVVVPGESDRRKKSWSPLHEGYLTKQCEQTNRSYKGDNRCRGGSICSGYLLIFGSCLVYFRCTNRSFCTNGICSIIK